MDAPHLHMSSSNLPMININGNNLTDTFYKTAFKHMPVKACIVNTLTNEIVDLTQSLEKFLVTEYDSSEISLKKYFFHSLFERTDKENVNNSFLPFNETEIETDFVTKTGLKCLLLA